MGREEIILLGAGGHARVVASTAKSAGHSVAAFYCDSAELIGSSMLDIPVRDIRDLESDKEKSAIIAIGDNATRKKFAEEYSFNWITLRHSFSWVDPDARIGVGTVICAGSIIQPGAKIGDHIIVNTKSSIDHDTTVGDFCHVSVAHLAGGGTAEEGSFMALYSVVLPGKCLGQWSTLGAGGVANKDIPPYSIAVGAPAKVIKRLR